MCRRAISVVHGTIWPGGREPARVSASTWANRLGQPGNVPGGGTGGSAGRPAPLWFAGALLASSFSGVPGETSVS